MPDREKVINAWEIFRNSNPYQICDGKEFRAIKEPEYCMGQMIEDTITLLKEQEMRECCLCKHYDSAYKHCNYHDHDVEESEYCSRWVKYDA